MVERHGETIAWIELSKGKQYNPQPIQAACMHRQSLWDASIYNL